MSSADAPFLSEAALQGVGGGSHAHSVRFVGEEAASSLPAGRQPSKMSVAELGERGDAHHVPLALMRSPNITEKFFMLSCWQVANKIHEDRRWGPIRDFVKQNVSSWHTVHAKQRATVRGLRYAYFTSKGKAGGGPLGVLHDHTCEHLSLFIEQLNAQFPSEYGASWRIPMRPRYATTNLDISVRDLRCAAMVDHAVGRRLLRAWKSLPKDHRGHITKSVHQIVFSRFFSTFAFDVPSERMRRQMVEDDWECRSAGRPTIDSDRFMESMRVTLEAWCETAELSEFEEFAEYVEHLFSRAVQDSRDEIQSLQESNAGYIASRQEKAVIHSVILASIARKNVDLSTMTSETRQFAIQSLVGFASALRKGQVPHFALPKSVNELLCEKVKPTGDSEDDSEEAVPLSQPSPLASITDYGMSMSTSQFDTLKRNVRDSIVLPTTEFVEPPENDDDDDEPADPEIVLHQYVSLNDVAPPRRMLQAFMSWRGGGMRIGDDGESPRSHGRKSVFSRVSMRAARCPPVDFKWYIQAGRPGTVEPVFRSAEWSSDRGVAQRGGHGDPHDPLRAGKH